MLFLMPAVLVLVISLVQENVVKTTVKILYVDKDKKYIGRAIKEQLKKTPDIKLVTEFKGSGIDEKTANNAVADGDFQFCIIIPEGTSDAVEKRAKEQINQALSANGNDQEKNVSESINITNDLIVYYDPTIQGIFRIAVINALHRVVSGMEMDTKIRLMSEILPDHINAAFQAAIGYDVPVEAMEDPLDISFNMKNDRILGIKEQFASKFGFEKMPTSVQQNVPAWTLFGIFFIVVPIAGSIIKERESGTFMRIQTMPVSISTLLFGKIIAYFPVCIIQFLFIFLIGKFVLPLLGTPPLDTGGAVAAIVLVIASVILAATGYGIMLGTICQTYEQASMFGPISIVVAAAIGGVMVPVYAMPGIMQTLSVYSPLAWGLNAFYDIFVRGGNVMDVLPEALFLCLFFVVTMSIACIFICFKSRNS